MFQMGFQQAFLPSRLQRNVSSFYFQHVCLPVRVGCMLNGNTFQLESAACASETSVLLVALFQVNLCFLKNQPLSTLQTRRVYQDTSKHRQVSPLSSLSLSPSPSLPIYLQAAHFTTYLFLSFRYLFSDHSRCKSFYFAALYTSLPPSLFLHLQPIHVTIYPSLFDLSFRTIASFGRFDAYKGGV